MGRGLSELQRRLLVYAKTGPRAFSPGVKWITSYGRKAQEKLKADILPETGGQWTANQSAAISQALRQLEKRGLIVRIRVNSKRRAESIVLTPQGDDLVTALYAELCDNWPYMHDN
jgi:hypothetical protein